MPDLMTHRYVWNIAAPMIGLGAVLLGLGVFAAWNVHKQQQTTSELIAREVSGMIAIEELHLKMREIRYQLNLFLRSRDLKHIREVAKLHNLTDPLLDRAENLARTPQEQELIGIVAAGYLHFFSEFQSQAAELLAENRQGVVTVASEVATELTHLSDEVLTDEVLEPLERCITVNQQVVERTNEASQQTAQHLKIGFLLLGICGGAAGLLMGTGIARAIGQSIVQLNVSIRSVVGRLSDVTGPVTFTHTGDLAGIETGLKKVEEEIADVVERLQQRETEVLRSEQLARVGQLAAGLAHELRNPLMPMKMLVQAAIERGDDAGLKGRSLQILNDEISRLEKAIQAFLDFARPPIPETAEQNVADVVRQTVELVQARAAQQAVIIELQIPKFDVVARIDRTQIRQLVLNLLLNALDELPGGGSIQVAVLPQASPPHHLRSLLPAPEPPLARLRAGISEHDALRLTAPPRSAERTAEPEWFAIRVTDDGPGIPPDLLDSVLEPFVTTKETGIGLGLSICQRIAASHQGRLQVRNRPNGGAEFTVVLPYAA